MFLAGLHNGPFKQVFTCFFLSPTQFIELQLQNLACKLPAHDFSAIFNIAAILQLVRDKNCIELRGNRLAVSDEVFVARSDATLSRTRARDDSTPGAADILDHSRPQSSSLLRMTDGEKTLVARFWLRVRGVPQSPCRR